MKNKDLVSDLQKLDPEAEVKVIVFGCSGYESTFDVLDAGRSFINDGKEVHLEIDVGCKVHKSPGLKKCEVVK